MSNVENIAKCLKFKRSGLQNRVFKFLTPIFHQKSNHLEQLTLKAIKNPNKKSRDERKLETVKNAENFFKKLGMKDSRDM